MAQTLKTYYEFARAFELIRTLFFRTNWSSREKQFLLSWFTTQSETEIMWQQLQLRWQLTQRDILMSFWGDEEKKSHFHFSHNKIRSSWLPRLLIYCFIRRFFFGREVKKNWSSTEKKKKLVIKPFPFFLLLLPKQFCDSSGMKTQPLSWVAPLILSGLPGLQK